MNCDSSVALLSVENICNAASADMDVGEDSNEDVEEEQHIPVFMGGGR